MPLIKQTTKNNGFQKQSFGSRKFFIAIMVCSIIVSSLFGGVVGFWAGAVGAKTPELLNWARANILKMNSPDSQKIGDIFNNKSITKVSEESDIVSVVKEVSPAVVSIIVSKDLPKMEQYYSNPFGGDNFFDHFFGHNFFNFQIPQYRQNGTEKREIGGGTGFIISADGYVVTNKHVASDQEAEYTVLMNDENKYDARVVARDPATDLAVLKIEGKDFPIVKLGESSSLKVGQTVIAIGNALGEFRNTVSVGVISGLLRSITAGGVGFGSEQLSGVIQTDASINPGNSGGPLVDMEGKVVGINAAMVFGAENIGFVLPINSAKKIGRAHV